MSGTVPISLNEAAEFIWREADLLDRGAYEDWLGLWAPDGRYIVPIDPAATDFENTLSYANDDHEMRATRVRRLTGGQSVSAISVARTVRTVSRFVTLSTEGAVSEIRCAQILVAYRREQTQILAGDLTYRLVAGPQGLRIGRKIVSLVNSTDSLSCFSFII